MTLTLEFIWNCVFSIIATFEVTGASSVDITEYKIIQEDGIWNTTQGSLPVRSILDCSRQCSEISNVCGLNYIRLAAPNSVTVKTCQCILNTDLNSKGSLISTAASLFYIRGKCTALFEAAVSASTTTALPSTTTSTPMTTTPTSTSTSSPQTSTTAAPSPTTTSVITTITPTTDTSQPTLTTTTPIFSTTTSTSTTTYPTTTTPTSTTAKSTSTTSPTTPTPTTPPTTTITTTTTTATTSTATTTTSTATTTTLQPSTTVTQTSFQTTTSGPCASTVDGLVCTENVIYLFINGHVVMYSSFQGLTTGPSQTETISTIFPEVTYPVTASYYDGGHIHILKGVDVWKYTSDHTTFVSTETTSSLFGSSSGNSYDAILQSATETYLFQGTSLSIAENGGITKTVSISNNGNKNPYKSSNYNDRPSQIDAGCSVDADRHVFISINSVYVFTFSTKLWENVGYLICD